jgi:anti-sigma B factor antagonist
MHNGRPELPALPIPEIVMLGACELRIQQLAGCVVVRPVGEIDLSNTDALRGHLSSLVERGHVVLDLSSVSFLDSTALGVLITVRKGAADCGTSIHLAGAYGTALRVLQITGLDVHLNHHDHVADAIEAALGTRAAAVGRNGRARLSGLATWTGWHRSLYARRSRTLEDDDLGTVRPIEGAAG